MKIVVAPDSFKGSLTAIQACHAISEGIRRVLPRAHVTEIPMADGGEGTVEALVASTGGCRRQVVVLGPLAQELKAAYGILGDDQLLNCPGKTAVIEMAAAAGLPLVPAEKRNPLHTTTYGLGQLILDALDQNCRNVIIGIGGSATNDCGTGMAQAMGAKFFDRTNTRITQPMNGGLMGRVTSIDISDLQARTKRCNFIVACDVTNPLLGPNGATHIYGPQKGADPEIVTILEANMSAIIQVIEHTVSKSVRDIPGAGAAGGLGAALMAFLDAELEPGIDIVLRYTRFAEKIRSADLVITAEGRVDATTASGKTISGIAGAAAKHSIPVIALAGSLGPDANNILDMGVTAVLPVCPGPVSLEQSMRQAAPFLSDTAERLLRILTMNAQ